MRRLVDGVRHDDRFTQGPTRIFNLLESSSNAALKSEYGLWLVTKDRALGLRVRSDPVEKHRELKRLCSC